MPHLRRRPAGSGHVGGDPNAPTVGAAAQDGGGLGDFRWVDTGFGFVEQQIWDGTQWIPTGDTRAITGGGDGVGRTQFPSEQALDEAQAERLRAQTEIDRARLQQEIDSLESRHQNALDLLNAELASADARQTEMIQANIDLENLRHQNDLAELRLQFENQLKTTLISELGARERVLIQEKGKARERQVERAGKDPFRFAFNIRGQEAPTTPEDLFKQRQMAFINQPLPQFGPDMTSQELQAILTQTQGIQPPQGGFLGLPSLAHGGVIDMKRGTNGAFSMSPTNEQTFLVGDGAGVIPGVTEALTVSQGKGGFQVKVTPIMGGFQEGGVLSPELLDSFVQQGLTRGEVAMRLVQMLGLPLGGPIDEGIPFSDVAFNDPFGPFIIAAAKAGLFLGFPDGTFRPNEPFTRSDVLEGRLTGLQGFGGGLPSPTPGFDPEALEAILNLANLPFLQKIRLGAGLSPTGPLGPEAFSKLGVLPAGVTPSPTTGGFATRNPLTLLRGLMDLGLPQTAATEEEVAAAQAALSEALASGNPSLIALAQRRLAQAQQPGATQISNQFGPFVSPFKAASTLGLGLRNLLPQERTGFQSLLGFAGGFTPQDINFQISEVTPTGQFFRPPRLGFQGRRF